MRSQVSRHTKSTYANSSSPRTSTSVQVPSRRSRPSRCPTPSSSPSRSWYPLLLVQQQKEIHARRLLDINRFQSILVPRSPRPDIPVNHTTAVSPSASLLVFHSFGLRTANLAGLAAIPVFASGTKVGSSITSMVIGHLARREKLKLAPRMP